ncbi:MAG: FtsQ-type POTRA domain-containing protein [Deltaproteobacteria bacterium]|nr:FtsQ-type POTRA domain-containing protein [Deltaproteobacteria bacterium]
MVYAYNFALCADYFQLKHITVSGCQRISEEKIKALAGISLPLNILTLNLEKMERAIEESPWVRNASVGREFPDRLVIEVTERSAVALLKKGNDLHIVDRNGVVFKKFETGDSADVPVLTGFYRDGDLQSDLLRKAFAFLDYLSGSDHFPRIWNVSEIYVDDVYDFSVVTDNHLFLNLGFEDYEKKLKRLRKVMADLVRRGLEGRTLSIDLVDSSRVVIQQGNAFSRKGPAGDRKTKI